MQNRYGKRINMEAVKAAEKKFIRKITISIITIFICLFGLSCTAYAFFSSVVVTKIALIQTAVFDLNVESVEAAPTNNDFYVLDNTSGATDMVYTFNIKKADVATAEVGFCRIDIKTNISDDYQTCYTKPIGKYLDNNTSVETLQRVIRIIVPAGEVANIKFTAEWGSYSGTEVFDESNDLLPGFAVRSDLQNAEVATEEQNEETVPDDTATP